MKHGIGGYNHHRCRCEVCCEANRVRRRRQRQAGKAPTHGASGYFNYGCRCVHCSAAGAEANAAASAKRGRPQDRSSEQQATRAAQSAKRQAETLDRAGKRYQQWTGAEMELVMRGDISARALALMLGRTYAAVVNMRRKIREEPKYRSVAGVTDADA